MVAIAKKINVYNCRKCGSIIITTQTDEGVIPFLIGCDACKDGEAESCFFQCPQDLKPKYEWFKPKNEDEIKKQIEWEMITFHGKHIEAALFYELGITMDSILLDTKKHVEQGGLLMRPVTDE